MNSINLDICGADRSGKTSLITRFTEESYKDSYQRTTGIHMGIRKVCLDNRTINLYMWDSILYNKPDSYSSNYFKSVDGLVFVLDCTNRESIDIILEWQKKLENEKQTHIPKILLCNKCDLISERTVSERTAELLAQEFNMRYFEVSGKNATQVEEAFITLTALIVNNNNSGQTR